MIEVKEVEKSYGSLQVLKKVSLTIENNKVVTIVGPSGAGKSTLLHIIGTLDKPDRGEVVIDGVQLCKLSDDKLAEFRNQHIGFVYQFHHLLPEFTALENVAMPALIAGMSRKDSFKRAQELLDFLKLGDRVGHKPAQLSGGEQQRVSVARALMNNPELILADIEIVERRLDRSSSYATPSSRPSSSSRTTKSWRNCRIGRLCCKTELFRCKVMRDEEIIRLQDDKMTR